MKEAKPKPYHHGDLRDAAIRVALEKLDAGGDLASLRALADRLGVAHRALYRHFENRKELERALAAVGLERLEAEVQGAQDVQGVAHAYLAFALDQSALYALVMSAGQEAFGREPMSVPLTRLLQTLRRVTEWPDARIQRLWLQMHGGIELYNSGLLDVSSRDEFTTWMTSLATQ